MYYLEDIEVVMVFDKEIKLLYLTAGQGCKYIFERLSADTTKKKAKMEFSEKFYKTLYHYLDDLSIDSLESLAKLEDMQKLSDEAPVPQSVE